MLRRVSVGTQSGEPAQNRTKRGWRRWNPRLVPAITLAARARGPAWPDWRGNLVEFRKAPAGFTSGARRRPRPPADNLFSLEPRQCQRDPADANRQRRGRDQHYVDTGGGNVLPQPAPTSAIPPAHPRQDDGALRPRLTQQRHVSIRSWRTTSFAMEGPAAFLFIPEPGNWTFSVRTDDGERLQIGTDNGVVTIFNGTRTAATDFHHGHRAARRLLSLPTLTWDQATGSAMAELFAQGPSQGKSGPRGRHRQRRPGSFSPDVRRTAHGQRA